jgi:hypothetical protein
MDRLGDYAVFPIVEEQDQYAAAPRLVDADQERPAHHNRGQYRER